MANIEDLLLTREHFPVFARIDGIYRKPLEIPINLVLPPHHPTMRKEGINPVLALSVLTEALALTSLDLNQADEKIRGRMYGLERIELEKSLKGFNARIAKLLGEMSQYAQERPRIDVYPFPLFMDLTIGQRGIYFKDHALEIADEPRSFRSFKPVGEFSRRLMAEYGMKTEGDMVVHSNGWYASSLGNLQRVFAKNFAIAYDNAVVRKKHQ